MTTKKDEPGPTAKALQYLRESANLSRGAVAAHLGWKERKYQHYEQKYKRDYLLPDLWPIVDLFEQHGVDRRQVERLFNHSLTSSQSNGSTYLPSNVLPAPRVAVAQGPENLPVYGSARGGPDGRFEFQGEALDYVRRPAVLENVDTAYAVHMVGDSMDPRYHEGELLFVHPGRPITRGCYVVVQVESGNAAPDAYVKQFVRVDGDRLVLRQLNPAEELILPRRQVVSMHRIVQSGER